mgnify:FL=1
MLKSNYNSINLGLELSPKNNIKHQVCDLNERRKNADNNK